MAPTLMDDHPLHAPLYQCPLSSFQSVSTVMSHAAAWICGLLPNNWISSFSHPWEPLLFIMTNNKYLLSTCHVQATPLGIKIGLSHISCREQTLIQCGQWAFAKTKCQVAEDQTDGLDRCYVKQLGLKSILKGRIMTSFHRIKQVLNISKVPQVGKAGEFL